MQSHRIWASLVLGQAQQKSAKIYEGGDVHEILLTLFQDKPGGADGLPADQASTAEPDGWAVSVAYKVSPETFIFQRTFPTDKEASDVFQDITMAAAGVEGLIRQEKFDEAQQATVAFLNKMKGNTSETPTETNA
jgi:hypothetical protein